MLEKKRWRFLLLTSLFLILFIPSVYAFLESLYYLSPDAFDVVQIYNNNRNTTHFLLFFFIISAAFRVFVSLWWGKDHEKNLGYFYVAFGALGGLSIAYLFAQYGYTIENFGWFFLFGIIVLMFLAIFSWFKGNGENKGAFPWGLLIFLLILAFLFLPVMFPSLNGILSANELFNRLWPLLLLAGIVWLLIWLLKSSFGGSSGGSGGGGSSGSGTPGFWSSMWERAKRAAAPGPAVPKGPKDRKITSVTIKKIPDKPRYNLGERVLLKADFSRKGFTGGSTIFEYEWFLGNTPIGSGPNMDKLDFQITSTHFTLPDEEKEFLVKITDTQNTANIGIGREKIRVISQPAEIIITTNRNVVPNISVTIGQDITLEYAVTGVMPKSNIGWAIIEGVQPAKISKKEFVKLTGLKRVTRFAPLDQKIVSFKAGDNYLGKATMKPNKVYTIIAYSLSTKVIPRFDALGNLIMGRVIFDVKPGSGSSGSSGSPGGSSGGSTNSAGGSGSSSSSGGNGNQNQFSMALHQGTLTSAPLIVSSKKEFTYPNPLHTGNVYLFNILNFDKTLHEVVFDLMGTFSSNELFETPKDASFGFAELLSPGTKKVKAIIRTKRNIMKLNFRQKILGEITATLNVINPPAGGQGNQGNNGNNPNPPGGSGNQGNNQGQGNQGNNNQNQQPPQTTEPALVVMETDTKKIIALLDKDNTTLVILRPNRDYTFFIQNVAKIKKPLFEYLVYPINEFKFLKGKNGSYLIANFATIGKKKVDVNIYSKKTFGKNDYIKGIKTIFMVEEALPYEKPTIDSTKPRAIIDSVKRTFISTDFPSNGLIKLVAQLSNVVPESSCLWFSIRLSSLPNILHASALSKKLTITEIDKYATELETGYNDYTMKLSKFTSSNTYIIGAIPIFQKEDGSTMPIGQYDSVILDLSAGSQNPLPAQPLPFPKASSASTSRAQSVNVQIIKPTTRNLNRPLTISSLQENMNFECQIFDPNKEISDIMWGFIPLRNNSNGNFRNLLYSGNLNSDIYDKLDKYDLGHGKSINIKIANALKPDMYIIFAVAIDHDRSISLGYHDMILINIRDDSLSQRENLQQGIRQLNAGTIPRKPLQLGEGSNPDNPIDEPNILQRIGSMLNLNRRTSASNGTTFRSSNQTFYNPQGNIPRQLNAVNSTLRRRAEQKMNNNVQSNGRTFTLGNAKFMFGLFDSNNLVTPLTESDNDYEYVYGEMNKNYLFKLVDENLDLNSYKLDFEISGLANNENFYESTDENNNSYAILEARSPGERVIACNILDRFTGKIVKTLLITLRINPKVPKPPTEQPISNRSREQIFKSPKAKPGVSKKNDRRTTIKPRTFASKR